MAVKNGINNLAEKTKNLTSIISGVNYSMEISRNEENEILKKRAKELAKSLQPDERGAYLEVVKFVLAGEVFGIEKEFAKEVFPLKDLTPLPGVKNFVMGIINLRGKILSIIDLKKFFSLPDNAITDLNRVILLKDNLMEFGILADKIIGVGKIYYNEIQKSLPTLKGIKEEYLKGISNDRVVLLDYKKLMNDERIIINEQVL